VYYLIKPNLLILYLSHNICHVVWNVRMYQSDWNHITYLPFTGMSKITSLTSLFLICLQSDISLTSPLLICCGMGDLSKPYYRSHDKNQISHLSPLYWYVVTWEIWVNPITGHMIKIRYLTYLPFTDMLWHGRSE
jgi:hypothetical protein